MTIEWLCYVTCTAPQKEAASAIGSAAGEQPGAVNIILVGDLEIRSSIALIATPLSHCNYKMHETRNMSDKNRRFGASCVIVKVT